MSGLKEKGDMLRQLAKELGYEIVELKPATPAPARRKITTLGGYFCNEGGTITKHMFPWLISVEHDSHGGYTVQYGKQIDKGLVYSKAAEKLGSAILHALQCDGRFDED